MPTSAQATTFRGAAAKPGSRPGARCRRDHYRATGTGTGAGSGFGIGGGTVSGFGASTTIGSDGPGGDAYRRSSPGFL